MFGFIKNLIGGILGFITGLFGKKDGYYLELKEEVAETKPVAAKPAVAPAAKAEPAKVAKASVTEEPTKAIKAEPAKPAASTETTFAPKYLMPSYSNGRRRPGVNMNTYMDMARQVKVPG